MGTLKMHDMKMRRQTASGENARHEKMAPNCWVEIARPEKRVKVKNCDQCCTQMTWL